MPWPAKLIALHYVVAIIAFKEQEAGSPDRGAPRTLIHNSVLNENIMRSESMMYETAD